MYQYTSTLLPLYVCTCIIKTVWSLFETLSQTEAEMEDVNIETPLFLDFSDLSHPHESRGIQKSLRFLKPPSEQSASIIENPLESSVELGVDPTLSNSHGSNTGAELMKQHLGLNSGERGSTVPEMGGQGSAFFKPIGIETDEQKLGLESERKHLQIKPTPRIYLNENELKMSPVTPPPLFNQQTTGNIDVT